MDNLQWLGEVCPLSSVPTGAFVRSGICVCAILMNDHSGNPWVYTVEPHKGDHPDWSKQPIAESSRLPLVRRSSSEGGSV